MSAGRDEDELLYKNSCPASAGQQQQLLIHYSIWLTQITSLVFLFFLAQIFFFSLCLMFIY